MLNKMSGATSQMGTKARSLIVLVCCMIVGAIFSFDPQSIYDTRRMIVLSLVTLVITVMYADGEIRPAKWNKLIILSIELFALLMIVIRALHPVGQGYLIYAFDILIVFPVLYTAVLKTSKYVHFIDLLTCAILLSGVACYIAGLFLAHGENERVFFGRIAGVAENPNYYGMIGLVMVMSGLYIMVRRHTNLALTTLIAVCIGIGISMTMAAISRTAMLASLGCAAVFVIYMIRWIKKARSVESRYSRSLSKDLIMFVLFVLVVALSAIGSLKMQQIVYLEKQIDNNVSKSIGTIVQIAYAEDGLKEQDEEDLDAIKNRFSVDTDLNSFSSGRLVIWQMYLERLNFLGNDYEAISEDGDFAMMRESRAHNNMLDYAFRFGIPAGLLYCVFYIAILIRAASMAFRKKTFDACDMWVVMTVAAYALYAMIEIATLPFTRYIPCLFFLSAAPLMCSREEDQDS